jgi:SAM-dependent methyltransferase
MTSPPRYDGLADRYDREIGGLEVTTTAIDALGRLVGPGPGVCLDLGCGTGVAIPELLGRGWRVVGVDLSGDQLRLARQRAGAPGASLLAHTDFDRPAAAFAEAARVLRRGGHLSYVGVHPCFVTPFVERHPSGARLLHPGYRRRGWHHAGPGFGRGIRPRVGVHHLPLADLIGVALGTGLRLTRLEEPGDDD